MKLSKDRQQLLDLLREDLGQIIPYRAIGEGPMQSTAAGNPYQQYQRSPTTVDPFDVRQDVSRYRGAGQQDFGQIGQAVNSTLDELLNFIHSAMQNNPAMERILGPAVQHLEDAKAVLSGPGLTPSVTDDPLRTVDPFAQPPVPDDPMKGFR